MVKISIFLGLFGSPVLLRCSTFNQRFPIALLVLALGSLCTPGNTSAAEQHNSKQNPFKNINCSLSVCNGRQEEPGAVGFVLTLQQQSRLVRHVLADHMPWSLGNHQGRWDKSLSR